MKDLPSKTKKASAVPECASGSSAESKILKEQDWPSLDLAGSDSLSKVWYLKSRIGMTMESLTHILPIYNNRDLMIISRSNDKGVWK